MGVVEVKQTKPNRALPSVKKNHDYFALPFPRAALLVTPALSSSRLRAHRTIAWVRLPCLLATRTSGVVVRSYRIPFDRGTTHPSRIRLGRGQLGAAITQHRMVLFVFNHSQHATSQSIQYDETRSRRATEANERKQYHNPRTEKFATYHPNETPFTQSPTKLSVIRVPTSPLQTSYLQVDLTNDLPHSLSPRSV